QAGSDHRNAAGRAGRKAYRDRSAIRARRRGLCGCRRTRPRASGRPRSSSPSSRPPRQAPLGSGGMDRLTDKIVLITGAAGAVGRAVAAAVAVEGGIAITSDLAGRPGAGFALDVTAELDWLRVIAEIGRMHRRLDGLVNAAGIAAFGNIED